MKSHSSQHMHSSSLDRSGRPKTPESPASSSVVSMILRLMECMLGALLGLFRRAILVSESFSSSIFDILLEICRIRPCETYSPDSSAILVLGVQEGVGRSVALQFSELGYTVFALCPNQAEEQSGHGPHEQENVSSLLYMWHNRKERRRSLPWGLIAPVSLDIWSNSQRQRALETVQTYCQNYKLKLVALVVSPAPGRDSLSSHILLHHLTSGAVNVCSECSAEEDRWRKRVLSQVTEPILMAHDYTRMLRETSGRIIIISPSLEDGNNFGFSIEGARRAVTRHLCDALQPYGIRVTSIVTGPIAEASPLSYERSDDLKRRSQFLGEKTTRLPVTQVRLRKAISWIHKHLAVSEKEIVHATQVAVQSRYPKPIYSIGLHSLLYDLLNVVPTSFLTTVKWLLVEIWLTHT